MRFLAALLLPLLASACSTTPSGVAGTTSLDAGGTTLGTGGSAGTGGSGGSGGAPAIGGDRPVDVIVPSGYKAGVAAPLLILLHGYSVDGQIQELFFNLKPLADKYGFLYAHPDGTVDSKGFHFWNATDGCCNFDGSPVDDSAYLASVVKEIKAAYTVDPKRVYFVGHSNGGFMSYRMACDHAGDIAAIVSLAGATWSDTTKCVPTEPVSVLQIHGTADTEVIYDGSTSYPGAETTVKDWATYDGCSLTPDTSSPPLDLDSQLAGSETTVERYGGCQSKSEVALYTIAEGAHIPAITDEFRQKVFDFLIAHPKP